MRYVGPCPRPLTVSTKENTRNRTSTFLKFQVSLVSSVVTAGREMSRHPLGRRFRQPRHQTLRQRDAVMPLCLSKPFLNLRSHADKETTGRCRWRARIFERLLARPLCSVTMAGASVWYVCTAPAQILFLQGTHFSLKLGACPTAT